MNIVFTVNLPKSKSKHALMFSFGLWESGSDLYSQKQYLLLLGSMKRTFEFETVGG